MKLILPDAKLHIKYCVGCWFWWLWYRDCGGAVGVICHCFTNRLVALAPRITILIQTQEMENWFLTRQITGKRSSVLFNQASLMENQPRQSFEHVQKNSILTTQFDMRQNIKLSNYMFCPSAWAYQQVILFKEICPGCPGIYSWSKVYWKNLFWVA